ncbi:MAG: hypothetical protein AB1656_02335 [Candidatus Omnitrophota bacterium]
MTLIKEKKISKTKKNGGEKLIDFVKLTKIGTYALVDKEFIVPRMEEQPERIYFEEEEYYYSIR